MMNSIQAINREHERIHERVVGAYQLREMKSLWLAADRGGASLSLVLMIMCERPTLIGLFIFIASLLHCLTAAATTNLASSSRLRSRG
jgi:hypothetical protein